MSVEKISATTPIVNPLPAKTEEKTVTPSAESDKKLSDSAKLMIGATLLAGTIAIGIIGHKNNWWRKAVREGENLSGSANHNPQPRTNPEPVPPHVDSDPVQTHIDTTNPQTSPQNPTHIEPTTPVENGHQIANPTPQANQITEAAEEIVHTPQLSPIERLIAKVDRTFSKELKHAKRALKQYNEVMDAVFETKKSFGGNYVKYLESKGYTAKDVNGKLFLRDGKGSLIIINNPTEGNKLIRPTFIEFFGKDGKLQKTVSFPESEYPLVMFYDKNEKVSKRIFPMLNIGSLHNPHVFVSYIKNGKVTKEAVYLQPEAGMINGDYAKSEVLNIAKYGKKVFETGKMTGGDSPRYIFIDNMPYLIYGNTAKQTHIGNIYLNDRRKITFNKNNQIITRLNHKEPGCDVETNIYRANDAKTGRQLYYLIDKNGQVDGYYATDLYTQKSTRRIFYELNDEPECYTIIPFINGKSAKDQIQIIHKSAFDTAPLYEPFEADYAPNIIMEPNRW